MCPISLHICKLDLPGTLIKLLIDWLIDWLSTFVCYSSCNDNHAISKKSCNVASFSFDGAACLEACWCYCQWFGHIIRETCDFLCPGCMPSMETVILSSSDATTLCVLLPLCIIFSATLRCGIIKSRQVLFINALSQSSSCWYNYGN